MARTERRARVGITGMGLIVLIAALLWIPVFSFGFSFSVVTSIAILAAARFAPAIASQWLLRTGGVFSVMYAVWDIRDDVISRAGMESDATMLAEITFIPGPVWGVIWIAVGLGTLFALRKWIV